MEYVPIVTLATTRSILLPTPLTRKVDRGSDFLSDISCHMGRDLQCKECHIYILHPGLECSGLQRLDKVAKFLGKAENELRGKFFLPPIWFKIQSLTSCTYNYAF